MCNRQNTSLDNICYTIHNSKQLGVRVFGDCDRYLLELQPLNV